MKQFAFIFYILILLPKLTWAGHGPSRCAGEGDERESSLASKLVRGFTHLSEGEVRAWVDSWWEKEKEPFQPPESWALEGSEKERVQAAMHEAHAEVKARQRVLQVPAELGLMNTLVGGPVYMRSLFHHLKLSLPHEDLVAIHRHLLAPGEEVYPELEVLLTENRERVQALAALVADRVEQPFMFYNPFGLLGMLIRGHLQGLHSYADIAGIYAQKSLALLPHKGVIKDHYEDADTDELLAQFEEKAEYYTVEDHFFLPMIYLTRLLRPLQAQCRTFHCIHSQSVLEKLEEALAARDGFYEESINFGGIFLQVAVELKTSLEVLREERREGRIGERARKIILFSQLNPVETQRRVMPMLLTLSKPMQTFIKELLPAFEKDCGLLRTHFGTQAVEQIAQMCAAGQPLPILPLVSEIYFSNLGKRQRGALKSQLEQTRTDLAALTERVQAEYEEKRGELVAQQVKARQAEVLARKKIEAEKEEIIASKAALEREIATLRARIEQERQAVQSHKQALEKARATHQRALAEKEEEAVCMEADVKRYVAQERQKILAEQEAERERLLAQEKATMEADLRVQLEERFVQIRRQLEVAQRLTDRKEEDIQVVKRMARAREDKLNARIAILEADRARLEKSLGLFLGEQEDLKPRLEEAERKLKEWAARALQLEKAKEIAVQRLRESLAEEYAAAEKKAVEAERAKAQREQREALDILRKELEEQTASLTAQLAQVRQQLEISQMPRPTPLKPLHLSLSRGGTYPGISMPDGRLLIHARVVDDIYRVIGSGMMISPMGAQIPAWQMSDGTWVIRADKMPAAPALPPVDMVRLDSGAMARGLTLPDGERFVSVSVLPSLYPGAHKPHA